MTMRVGRRRTYAPKRKSTSRSATPWRGKIAKLSGRTRAIAAPSVGLGTSCTTVLRTSFFYNASLDNSGIYKGFLKPGSAFDPCGDLAGIQPQMYDQFSAQYNRYKVNSCTVRIKITGGATNGSSVWCGAAYPAVDSSALTTYQAAASQQYAKTTSGGFNIINGSPAVGVGTEGKYLSFKLNHNKIVGAKSDTWDIGAPVTSDPTTLQFMVLPIFIQANTAVNGTMVLEIDMWQNVTFSQKKNVVDA